MELAGVLAQDAVAETLPEWAEALGVVTTLVLILVLWLRGILKRAKDCDDAMTAVKEAHATELATVRQAHATELATAAEARRLVGQRLDAVVADRDAWRDAQREEAEARRAAERMARDMMESTNISLALLSALKDMAAGKLER